MFAKTEHQTCEEPEFETPFGTYHILTQTILSHEDNANLNTLCQAIFISQYVFHTANDSKKVLETIFSNIQQDIRKDNIFEDLEDCISLGTSTDSLTLGGYEVFVQKQQIKQLKIEKKNTLKQLKEIIAKVQEQNNSI
ncbi:hypothetical protein ACSBR2_029934 [Camellia fascicularis]